MSVEQEGLTARRDCYWQAKDDRRRRGEPRAGVFPRLPGKAELDLLSVIGLPRGRRTQGASSSPREERPVGVHELEVDESRLASVRSSGPDRDAGVRPGIGLTPPSICPFIGAVGRADSAVARAKGPDADAPAR